MQWYHLNWNRNTLISLFLKLFHLEIKVNFLRSSCAFVFVTSMLLCIPDTHQIQSVLGNVSWNKARRHQRMYLLRRQKIPMPWEDLTVRLHGFAETRPMGVFFKSFANTKNRKLEHRGQDIAPPGLHCSTLSSLCCSDRMYSFLSLNTITRHWRANNFYPSIFFHCFKAVLANFESGRNEDKHFKQKLTASTKICSFVSQKTIHFGLKRQEWNSKLDW